MRFNELKRKIKNLEIQGAKEIALASLEFFRDFCKKHGFGEKFEKYASELEKVRPTAVVLHNCLEILRMEKSIEKIDELIETLRNAGEKIAFHGSEFLESFGKKLTIMTYCHSSEAVGIIKEAWKQGVVKKVFAPETRPKCQGLKTAKELANYGVSTTLITDNARGTFIKECDLVIVGSDAMRKEGNINKIGTFTLALLAKHFKKPFFVAGNMLKLDFRKSFEIEERAAEEIARLRIKNLEIRNPAFDITPWKYVSRIITDEGIFTPKKILKKFN